MQLVPLFPLEPNEADTWPQQWARRLSALSEPQRTAAGRRLAGADGGCMPLDIGIPQAVPGMSIYFGFDIVFIVIKGSFGLQPTLKASLIGELCMSTFQVRIRVSSEMRAWPAQRERSAWPYVCCLAGCDVKYETIRTCQALQHCRLLCCHATAPRSPLGLSSLLAFAHVSIWARRSNGLSKVRCC